MRMKTVAVMQPYFFPYLGYYQLVAASSAFVFLDDVTFINRGWINRNRFLVKGSAHLFTVPLRGASIHRFINEIEVADEQNWRTHFLCLLEHSYARAPYLAETLRLVQKITLSSHSSISLLAEESIRAVCEYVGLETQWQNSSIYHPKNGLKGAARIIDICRRLNATRYVNAPGGKALYTDDEFNQHGIELRFLRPTLPPYGQNTREFVEGLSIIDVLMFNPPDKVRSFMEAYELE